MAIRNYTYILLTQAVLGIMAATSAAAQEMAQVPESPALQPSAGLDAPSILVLILAACGLLWGGIILKRRVDDQRLQDELADARFEMEMVSRLKNLENSQPLLGADDPTGHVAFQPIELDGETGEVQWTPPAQDSTATAVLEPAEASSEMKVAQAGAPALSLYNLGTDDKMERADVVAAAAINQLRNAGLVNDVDGYAELHGNPNGSVVLRMKDGRRALLVPHHESEAFSRRNLKRYDLLIFVGRDGRAVVLNTLENLIAEKMSGRFS